MIRVPKKPRVFVYGTLKQNRGNHRYLRDETYLGRCMIQQKRMYAMADLGGIPGVIDLSSTPEMPTGLRPTPILGEVYEITEQCLAMLDSLEGNGHFYTRKKIPTPYRRAWCYFIPVHYAAQRVERPLALVEQGIWRPNDEELAWAASLNS